MMFSDQSAINAHYDTAHSSKTTRRAKRGEGAHECEVCCKKFTEKAKVRRHLATIHGIGDVKTFQCDVCLRVFNRKDNLREHVKKVHKCA